MPRNRISESAAGDKSERTVSGPTIPTLTHLQFLVLDLFTDDRTDVSAQQMMGQLEAAGVEQHGPKFYQLMKRLEEAAFITSCVQTLDVAGGNVQRTFYRMTKEGRVAWTITADFYAIRARLHATLRQDKNV